MATIAVRVGREVKEISGLAKSTTCWDVVLALLKEKQQQSTGTDSAAGATDKSVSGEHATEESASNSSTSKSIKELAQSYVIVENWRGCEKPIPPRTRILNVWQAWGKEQRHVELTLKKSKHIRYREGVHNRSLALEGMASAEDGGDAAQDHYSLHCMTSHQKRRIRRNMRQYQRAVMMKQNEEDDLTDELQQQEQTQAESNENKQVLFEDARQAKADGKSEKRNGLILSEEKFIDGFLADPDCLIKRADRAALISQGTFNREFCKYRRRNHRRYGSLDSRQHRRREVSHYPYSSQHDRRRSSRHRGSSSKSPKYRYSTDDTSTASSMTNSSENEDADDADDEKSVLIEFSCPVPRRSHSYAGIGGRVYDGGRATTAATDSSTTTSGDSMTSSTGGSTSSETSSGGGDSFWPELNRLSYGQAIENTRNSKGTEISSSKPKKNKSILGGFSKPAFNLIESFRKTNLKRKSAKKNNPASLKQGVPSETTCKNQSERSVGNKQSEMTCPQPLGECDKKSITEVSSEKMDTEKIVETLEDHSKEDAVKSIDNTKAVVEDDGDEQDGMDEVSQTIYSQDIVLKNQQNRLTNVDDQIERIENDIHNLRTRALGKNYVQDTYLSGFVEPDASGIEDMANFFNGPSIPVTTPWILQCNDANALERFTKMSEKIVEMQLQIEEYNRKEEILLQDMQEEVWRASTDTVRHNTRRNTVTKAPALMLGFSEDDDSADDEDGHKALCVKSQNVANADPSIPNVDESAADTSKTSQDSLLERSRTELEASLYLSIRLAAEIDDAEHKLGASAYFIQTKGEDLLKCVRDLAMSEEGVAPEVWEEYGELLTAYDFEVQQRDYLETMDASHVLAAEADITTSWHENENTLYIDATQPNPTLHCVQSPPNSPAFPLSEQSMVQPPPPALHHALSPCLWCEHCKMEERVMQSQTQVMHGQKQCHPHSIVTVKPPTLFSKLPLPTPINRSSPPVHCPTPPHTPSAVTSGLLPMLPIPDGLMSPHQNDSDYDDLPDLTNMSPRDPTKSSRECSILADNESSNNTDDSGNGSSGSTMSFASSDGSRNSSCDGGSPRPIPIISEVDPGSKQLFSRNGVLRGSWRGHFVFPSNPKQNDVHLQSTQNRSSQSLKAPPPLSPASCKSLMKKPELSPKPSALTLKKANVVDSKDREILMQQQRLIRRNSGGRRRNTGDVLTGSESTSCNESKKLQNVSSSKLHLGNGQRQAWNQLPTSTAPNESSRLNSNYDNDSDTGRSSLHSVDSDQVICSETLV